MWGGYRAHHAKTFPGASHNDTGPYFCGANSAMTPASARASLDHALKLTGEDVTLQRLLGTQLVPVSVSVRAHIKDYAPHEMIAGSNIVQGDSRCVISTTEIDAAQWPGGVVAAQYPPATMGDLRIPRKGDRVIMASGKVRTVQYAWPAPMVGGELVRIELQIR